MDLSGAAHDSRAFSFLTREECQLLEPHLKSLRLGRGETLFHDGEHAETLYFLVDGRVSVQKKTGFGERTQVVALLGPGAPVGEGGLVEGHRRGATVSAVEDTQLYSLSRATSDELFTQQPQLMLKLTAHLLHITHLRLQKSSERLVHVL